MSRRSLRPVPSEDQQLHLFAPVITDVSPRDARDVMEFPFLSLSKRKRIKPIDYTSPSGQRIFVHASPKTGIRFLRRNDSISIEN
jgi:plasmid replication initiation protein